MSEVNTCADWLTLGVWVVNLLLALMLLPKHDSHCNKEDQHDGQKIWDWRQRKAQRQTRSTRGEANHD